MRRYRPMAYGCTAAGYEYYILHRTSRWLAAYGCWLVGWRRVHVEHGCAQQQQAALHAHSTHTGLIWAIQY